jgi:hypothetical protein
VSRGEENEGNEATERDNVAKMYPSNRLKRLVGGTSRERREGQGTREG